MAQVGLLMGWEDITTQELGIVILFIIQNSGIQIVKCSKIIIVIPMGKMIHSIQYQEISQVITVEAGLNVLIEGIVSASLADGNLKRPNFLNKLGFGKRGYYSVYLCLDLEQETNYGVINYHWYRQDKGGFWSQKHGSDLVTNVDGSGRLIRNPARANQYYGSYSNRYGNYVGDLNYRNGGIFLWAKKR
jgi:hypothetical protein